MMLHDSKYRFSLNLFFKAVSCTSSLFLSAHILSVSALCFVWLHSYSSLNSVFFSELNEDCSREFDFTWIIIRVGLFDYLAQLINQSDGPTW